MAFALGEAEQVNALRHAAGLPALLADDALALAARRHAAYLDQHRQPGAAGQGISAHQEQPDRPGFSGESPAQRALQAGYPHRQVLENVSMGYDDARAALRGLMSAIYHRLTFLDLYADQMGVAVGQKSRVFVLGRRDLHALCSAPPGDAVSRTPVDCNGIAMTRQHYDALCADLPAEARFVAPHPVACPNGTRLDAEFMRQVCSRTPRAARFAGYGRYYEPCDNGTRIDAGWFDMLCMAPPPEAAYVGDGSYFSLCQPAQRVGADWLEGHCANLPQQARYTDSGRYRRPCASDVNIRSEYLDQLDRSALQAIPEVVLWPPPDAAAVPPAFFIEEPDPLPDLEVSGYPISLQFNPAQVAQVEVLAFRLLRVDGETETPIEQTRLLSQASDPNQLLSAHEFALFPIQRLAWGQRYRVMVDARVDGRQRNWQWDFTTDGADLPLLTAADARSRFVVRAGADYLLYLPPQAHRAQTVDQVRVEYRRGNSVELEVVDPNSLRLRLTATHCAPVRLDFNSQRVVEVIPAGCAE